MNLVPLVADRNSSIDRQHVADVAVRVLATVGGRAVVHPSLHEMVEGRWPEEVSVCFAYDGQHVHGLIAVEDDPAIHAVRAFAFWVDETLPARNGVEVLAILLGHVMIRAVALRRQNMLLSAGGLTPELQMLVRAGGFTEGDQPGVWRNGTPVGDFMKGIAQPYGSGRWAVILHNDEVTTMDVVVLAIRAGVGVREAVAEAMMSMVHMQGSATVRRHWFRWTAMCTKTRMDRIFHRAGFGTRVDVAYVLPAQEAS